MPIPLSGTDSLVSGALEPLFDMGRGRNSVSRATQSPAEGHSFVLSSMLALRWIEEKVIKYRESRAPTMESIHAIDYSRMLDLFETVCKVFPVPKEVRHA